MKAYYKGKKDVELCEKCAGPETKTRPFTWLHGPFNFKTSWAFHADCYEMFMTRLRDVLELAVKTR